VPPDARRAALGEDVSTGELRDLQATATSHAGAGVAAAFKATFDAGNTRTVSVPYACTFGDDHHRLCAPYVNYTHGYISEDHNTLQQRRPSQWHMQVAMYQTDLSVMRLDSHQGGGLARLLFGDMEGWWRPYVYCFHP